MSVSSRIRLGFIGVGTMGQCAHLQNYASLPDCEVVALAELRPALRDQVARRYGVPRVYASHSELLANEELDGLVASQPYSRHGQLLPDLYRSGIPVLTEKPLARSLQVGEQLAALAAETGARHYIGYHKRSDPATMYAVEVIRRWQQSGEFGAMRYVRVTMPPGDWIAGGFRPLIRTDENYPETIHDAPAADLDADTYHAYDTFVNYYIHQVNLLRHLLGEDYRVSFVDDAGVLLGATSDSGVTGLIEMAPYHTTVDWQESALVAFERGYLRLELPAPVAHNRPGRVQVYRDPGQGVTPERSEPQLPWVHAMQQQAINYIHALQGQTTPLCGPQTALDDLRIAHSYITQRFGV